MVMRSFILFLLALFLSLFLSFVLRQWEPFWWLFLASLPAFPLAALSYFVTFASKNSPMKFWTGRTVIDYSSSSRHPLTRVFPWLRARFARDGFLVLPPMRKRMIRTLIRLEPIAFFLDRRVWERSFFWQAQFYTLTALFALPAYLFYLVVFLFLFLDPLIFSVPYITLFYTDWVIHLYKVSQAFIAYGVAIFRLQDFSAMAGPAFYEQAVFYRGNGNYKFSTFVFAHRFPYSFFPFSFHHLMALTVPPALYFHYRLMISISQRYWEVFGPGPLLPGAIDRMDVWEMDTLRLHALEGTILGLWINLFFIVVFYGYWFIFPLLRVVF